MAGMSRPRPPYLQREKTRHGKLVWFVRVGRGPRTRLRAAYGTPEFQAEYLAAINGEPLPGVAPRVLATSLQWLWDSYRETGAWTELAASTRKQRENIMLHILKDSGAKPYAAIGKANIVAGLDRRSKTPAAARNFLDTMRGMFEWAAERKHVKADPTVGVKGPKRKKGKGFPAWTREDIETYLKSDEWRDKAGGYAIQGRAEAFVRYLAGSHSNVVGLPVFETLALLRSAGMPLG